MENFRFVFLKERPKTVGPPVHQRAKQKDAKLTNVCSGLYFHKPSGRGNNPVSSPQSSAARTASPMVLCDYTGLGLESLLWDKLATSKWAPEGSPRSRFLRAVKAGRDGEGAMD